MVERKTVTSELFRSKMINGSLVSTSNEDAPIDSRFHYKKQKLRCIRLPIVRTKAMKRLLIIALVKLTFPNC